MLLLLGLTPAFLLPTARPAPAALRPGHQPRTTLVSMNHYATLGVERTATAAQIKQAYRRLALRNHPDVNKAPDAQETFAKIAEAYSVLGDAKQRAEYDRRPQGGASAGYGSTAGGRSYSSGYSSARAADRAAYAERRRQSREPTPDELGDSFGALFSDLIGAVGKVVAGGDWMDLLDDLQADGPELQMLLRSRDVSVLRDELEEAKWVEGRLRARQQRLREEAREAKAEAERYRARRLANPTSSVGREIERQLERDSSRWEEQARNADRLMLQVQQRQRKIEARILELGRGGGGGGGGGGSGGGGGGYGGGYGGGRSSSSSGPRRSLPSVEEELQRMKREMGK